MTQQEIKAECDKFRENIKVAKFAITTLQNTCQHPNTVDGNWSYRVGVIEPATICSDCGCLVKVHCPELSYQIARNGLSTTMTVSNKKTRYPKPHKTT